MRAPFALVITTSAPGLKMISWLWQSCLPALDHDIAVHHIGGAFDMVGRQTVSASGRKHQIAAQHIGKRLYRRCQPVDLSRDHRQDKACIAIAGQFARLVMQKFGRGFFMLRRQGQPCLKPEQPALLAAQAVGGPLGMDDALPRRHPIDRARFDHLLAAQRVLCMIAPSRR
jgi:hypothetical protein